MRRNHTVLRALRQIVPGAVACAALMAAQAALAGPPADKANPRVRMEVEKRGALIIELYPKSAPKTVAHFLELVNKKFYDGILFHRYVGGFVIQAGDPKSKKVDSKAIADITPEEVGQKYQLGDGGSGKTVPLEAKLPHERGTVGLARSNDPDSGDSQFFFNLVDNDQLTQRTPGYCVFGKVIEGVDIMDKLRQGDRITSVREVKAKDKKPKK